MKIFKIPDCVDQYEKALEYLFNVVENCSKRFDK